MLYDLQCIGVDLRDVFRPDTDVTPRYVLWIAEHLPPESAVSASLRGGHEFRAWTPTTHLLAGAVNLLNAANRQRGGKRTREPLVSPPRKPKTARRITVAEIAARQRPH